MAQYSPLLALPVDVIHSIVDFLTDGEMYLLALTRTALHWTMQYRIKRRTQMSSRGQRQVLAYSGPFRSGHHACFRCGSVHRYGETRDLFRSMLCWRWLAIFLQI
jgi:hypothetical protein